VGIGAGNLDQLVPITSNDELGQLVAAFQFDGPPASRVPPLPAGAVDAGPADQPGDDRFVSGPRAGGRPAAARGNGQSGGAAAVGRAARGKTPAVCRSPGSRRTGCGSRWPTCFKRSAAYLPEGFDSALVLHHESSRTRICLASCRFGIRRERRSARRCSWKTSPVSGCWTR